MIPPMRLLRASIRFVLVFFVLTPFFFAVRMLVWPSALVSERLDRRLRRGIITLWNKGFALIAGIKIVCTGTAPKPPFVIVANHLSWVDISLLTNQTGCIFVARGDVEHWPVIGFIIKSLYIIFIDRLNKRDTLRVNAQVAHALEQGDGVAVFPESRIFCGLDVEPFKAPIIQPAVAAGIPVHYLSIRYETPPGSPPPSRIISWWRPEPFPVHLFRLLGYPGFTAELHFGPQPVVGTDRKALAVELRERVRAEFTPLR